nr:tegument protein UL88 [Mastomys natalensis cytomegalovirus 3]WEG69914.1 tegument protein UL88 [Mastomys natalensis cytomegalovirus 3]WEG70054.1 tegument protein UL88 [Mastomys natalensis cytomegalovirus 3]WEG70194.1 tegument protein UL88 [Mastomys natalensis cytomegalovirus 3]WEG70334.1 tegument protein UL88 [Mastomys natalensis cytomegalovirus 3]
MNEPISEDSIVVRDAGAVWSDGSLVMSDGTLIEHQFHNKSLVALIRRKVKVERNCEDVDFISCRELSLFVTGRCRRRTSGVSIYWHTYSDLIYVLTGATYCAQIYIECGRDLMDGGKEVFAIPRVYLVRARDPSTGISEVAWSQTTGIWPRDVIILLAKLPPNVPNARPPIPVSPHIGMVGFPVVAMDQEIMSATHVPLVIGDRESMSRACSDTKLRLDWETSMFLERASAVYRRLLAPERELENSIGRRREVLTHCLYAASKKTLMLVDGLPIVNFFAVQVCLYGLGEDNMAESIIGVLYRRRDRGTMFNLHNIALANAMQLSLILRRIQEFPENLPQVEERPDMSEVMMVCAREFYGDDMDIEVKTLVAAADVLRAFSVRGVIEDAVRVLDGRIPMSGCINRKDVIKILML